MSPRAIVSYDDTPNDHDALMLGRVLADAGAELTLAYVRHARTATAQQRGSSRSRRPRCCSSAAPIGSRGLSVERRVIVSPSTPEGLSWLAEQEEADIVVFGSDYRTAARTRRSAALHQALLEGGTAAVAIAPAGYHGERAPQDPPDRRARDSRRRRGDRDGPLAGRQLRRDAHARRAPGRPADRRVAP